MPAIFIKPINPSKMKDKAFRLNALNEMKHIGSDVRRDFQKTTATWKEKPKFEVKVNTARGELKLEVFTTNEIYGYIDEGTPKRDIVPKKASILRFPGTFSAKTIPGVISSTQGYSGPPMVFTPIVRDHEIKARGFSDAIRDEWDETFQMRMDNALDRAAQESGHDP